MKIVGVLPAKGSSKRVENKNVLPLFDRPLFRVNLEKLIRIDEIDEAYLDTEAEDMIEMVEELDCKVLKRDPSLATNATDGNELLLNEAKQIDADIYVMLLATSPFIRRETIKRGINKLINNDEYDSVVAVQKDKLYLWDENGNPKYDIDNIPNSYNLEDTIIETMGLYIIKKDALFKTKRRIGDNPYLLDVSTLEAIDINYMEDYETAKIIERGMNNLWKLI